MIEKIVISKMDININDMKVVEIKSELKKIGFREKDFKGKKKLELYHMLEENTKNQLDDITYIRSPKKTNKSPKKNTKSPKSRENSPRRSPFPRKGDSPKKTRCWNGYEPVPNKKAYSKGSCRKITKT